MVGLSVLTGDKTPKDNNWTTVINKKGTLNKETLEEKLTTMNKTKITIMIRVPSNETAEFSAAEVHIATIRELSKQDDNIIILNHKGTSQVNIHKSFGHEKYKEFFQPREKAFRNGSIQVSVAHHILSDIKSFNKALMLPFLQKN
jgi:pectate lyase